MEEIIEEILYNKYKCKVEVEKKDNEYYNIYISNDFITISFDYKYNKINTIESNIDIICSIIDEEVKKKWKH